MRRELVGGVVAHPHHPRTDGARPDIAKPVILERARTPRPRARGQAADLVKGECLINVRQGLVIDRGDLGSWNVGVGEVDRQLRALDAALTVRLLARRQSLVEHLAIAIGETLLVAHVRKHIRSTPGEMQTVRCSIRCVAIASSAV